MAHTALAAQPRNTCGKEAARKLRMQGRIPAVFYGPGKEAVSLIIDRRELEKAVKTGAGENTLFELRIFEEQGVKTFSAMLKELQIDPVRNSYLHADFYEIAMDREITVQIPVELVNTPVGVTKGGMLQPIRREITVSCLPDKLIDTLKVDVSGLDAGDALHIEDLALPEGVRAEEDGHLTVAVVASPAAEEVVEEEAAEEETVSESSAES